MAGHAVAPQLKHELCMYTVSEMVGEWETQFSSLGPKQRPPSLKYAETATNRKCVMEPWQCWGLIFWFTLVIPAWNLEAPTLGRAKGTLVAGGMCYLLLLSCRTLWCFQKCPWDLSLPHGGHCTPKQDHGWATRPTEVSIPVWKAGVLGKRPS